MEAVEGALEPEGFLNDNQGQRAAGPKDADVRHGLHLSLPGLCLKHTLQISVSSLSVQNIQGLTVSPRLEYSGMNMAHCSLTFHAQGILLPQPHK
ncbi:hypothetical protein AAY473_027572 [Plecturocebus cupreus]